MSKIKIIADSACDVQYKQAEQMGFDVIPIPIIIDNKQYLDGIDFSPREFYDMMDKAESIPTTSQISVYDYFERFEKCYKEGYTAVILLSITSTTSSTYLRTLDGKKMFFEEYPESEGKFNIHSIDSRNFSLAYGYPAQIASQMAQDGATEQEILDYLDDWINSVEVYFSAFSFEYIKKSGRIGAASAFVGEVMGIRPIIRIMDGEIKVIDKVRGNNNVSKAFAKIAKERMMEDKVYGILTGTFDGVGQEMIDLMEAQTGGKPCAIQDVGCCVAINSGHKMLGIMFKGKNRKEN